MKFFFFKLTSLATAHISLINGTRKDYWKIKIVCSAMIGHFESFSFRFLFFDEVRDDRAFQDDSKIDWNFGCHCPFTDNTFNTFSINLQKKTNIFGRKSNQINARALTKLLERYYFIKCENHLWLLEFLLCASNDLALIDFYNNINYIFEQTSNKWARQMTVCMQSKWNRQTLDEN